MGGDIAVPFVEFLFELATAIVVAIVITIVALGIDSRACRSPRPMAMMTAVFAGTVGCWACLISGMLASATFADSAWCRSLCWGRGFGSLLILLALLVGLDGAHLGWLGSNV